MTEKLTLARSYVAVLSPNDRSEKDSSPRYYSNRETKIEIHGQTDADLAFLMPKAMAPLLVRLARELAETIRAARQDPLAFISAIPESGSVPRMKRSRMRAGIMVAIVVYGLALSAIYASYVIFHRAKPSTEAAQHLEITYLGAPALPVKKALPVFKATGTISKSQLPSPTPPAEQPRAELIEAKPSPRPLDQTQSKTEPTGPSSPAGENASAVPASGLAGAEQGTGNGAGSDTGRAGGSSADVNYNGVFSISSVTTRPQILARPVPGYTEEARQAQVEGAVRLSVVLSADSTVSDIKVAHGLGHGLDEKAIEAARQLRFVPAQKDGHTVSVRVFLEFKFSLL